MRDSDNAKHHGQSLNAALKNRGLSLFKKHHVEAFGKGDRIAGGVSAGIVSSSNMVEAALVGIPHGGP